MSSETYAPKPKLVLTLERTANFKDLVQKYEKEREERLKQEPQAATTKPIAKPTGK